MRDVISSHLFTVLSIPTRRYAEDIAMIPGLLKLGASVGRMLEALDKRVAVVISSDLAHTHLASTVYSTRWHPIN